MTKRSNFVLGDWNAVCPLCGRTLKASGLVTRWDGVKTCRRCWDPRHPQDFVRQTIVETPPPFTQPPPADVFVTFCTPNGSTGIAGFAIAGCAIAGYIHPAFDINITDF